MLSFQEVNSWFDANIKNMTAMSELPTGVVESAGELYKKQSQEFKDSADKLIANEFGTHILDTLSSVKAEGYKPGRTDRVENGLGFVLYDKHKSKNTYALHVCLVVPEFYILSASIEFDSDKNVKYGSVNMKTYYESAHLRRQHFVTTVGGDTLKAIYEFKFKVDSGAKLDPESKMFDGPNINFVPGKGLVGTK